MSINERKDKTGKIQEVPLNLAAHEQQALTECRAAIASNADLDDLRDATLVRFLRNNSFQVAPSITQLEEYMSWRQKENIDTILTRPFPSRDLIRTVIPYAYHNTDKEGRPVYIERTGRIATNALADEKIVSPDDLLYSHIYGLELQQKLMYESSLRLGKRVNGITTILDMEGLGFQHRSCLFVLKTCMDFDKKYYPEYLDKLFVINSPWVAPYLYQAVQVFLDEITKSRVQIIADNPAQFLLTQIPAENLPKHYGGACTGAACNHGGMGEMAGLTGCVDVLDSSKLAAADVSGLDAQDISYDFEKEMTADAEGHVFTWYFEVRDGYDIDFSIELLPISGAREADPSKKVLIRPVERLKTGKGTFKAPYAGAKLLFRWDNNFSYFTSKHIKYTVTVVADDANMEQLMGTSLPIGSSSQ